MPEIGMHRTRQIFSSVWILLAFLLLMPLAVGASTEKKSSGFQEKWLTRAQLAELQQGGFVIFMRHGKTAPIPPDQPKVDFADCSTQRMLSAEGREMAARIGGYLREAKIPIGEIYVSPMCRTKESAEQVFGPQVRKTYLVGLFSSTNQTSEEKKPIIETTRRLLSSPVASGLNRFILAHAPNLADAMGYFPRSEGMVVVFVPRGDHFDYVGSVRPDMWEGLIH